MKVTSSIAVIRYGDIENWPLRLVVRVGELLWQSLYSGVVTFFLLIEYYCEGWRTTMSNAVIRHIYVWVRLSILSVIHYTIHYTICRAMCFQFTHLSCDDLENIYTLSYYHHQIGSMSYYPLVRVRSWNNAVRCMSFYIHCFAGCLSHHKWKLCCRLTWPWKAWPGDHNARFLRS